MLGIFCFSSCGKSDDVEPESGLETSEAFQIDATSAKITVNMDIAGNITIDEKGICWDIASKPTVEDETYDAGSGPDAFTGTLTDLSSRTKYYARSYYISDGQVRYGNEISFTTEDSPFVGEWANSGGTLVFTGTPQGLIFKVANTSKWSDAVSKGFVTIGNTLYIRNLVKDGNGYRCEALWNSSTSSQGVLNVRYSANSRVTFNAAGTELYLESYSPYDGSYAAGTLYKK